MALIPETVRATRLQGLHPGGEVNVEVDPVGRYVARSLALQTTTSGLEGFARRGWGSI